MRRLLKRKTAKLCFVTFILGRWDSGFCLPCIIMYTIYMPKSISVQLKYLCLSNLAYTITVSVEDEKCAVCLYLQISCSIQHSLAYNKNTFLRHFIRMISCLYPEVRKFTYFICHIVMIVACAFIKTVKILCLILYGLPSYCRGDNIQ